MIKELTLAELFVTGWYMLTDPEGSTWYYYDEDDPFWWATRLDMGVCKLVEIKEG